MLTLCMWTHSADFKNFTSGSEVLAFVCVVQLGVGLLLILWNCLIQTLNLVLR